ncbi:MAG: KilA-N domain-containing protein [Bacteroidaceae bacterium]|nr:KilA-N domain-containing protein [Bacteroidaceae bacterium]
MVKTSIIQVEGIEIAVTTINNNDYISITDMIKAKDGDFFISDWLRNRNTLQYLGAWESMYNPNFNYGEFAIIKDKSGLNNFKISVKEWVAKTNAIGLTAKAGRYGGTYAHKDIAFHFCMWISPEFQLYVVKEYQRLKEIENNQYNLEWNVKRVLSKANYQLQTDAIKNYILPQKSENTKEDWVYADEADILNLIMFNCTAKQWILLNPQRVLAGENIRDMASINELNIISNLESLNATLIKQGVVKKDRFTMLLEVANEQRKLLEQYDYIKSIKKIDNATYVDAPKLSQFDQSLTKALNYNPKDKEPSN